MKTQTLYRGETKKAKLTKLEKRDNYTDKVKRLAETRKGNSEK